MDPVAESRQERTMPGTRVLALALGLVLAAAPLGPAKGQPREGARVPACALTPVAAGIVRRVGDGRTFLLDDGREIRLAAIEAPPIASLHGSGERERAGLAAKAALAALVEGNEIVLKHVAPSADRYGRLLAFAFVTRDGQERSVQRELLMQGHARVAARLDDRACAAELTTAEQAARAAKLGLWADPYYVVKSAENPAEVMAERGRFTLVRGKVLSVRESGGTIYVNFGRRWSEDFTVTIRKRHERMFVGAGLEPKKLAGRLVEVRGWIEERGGPWIEATRPEQIAIVAGN
jgi:endonuclease YncB( thermonuclease family)